MTPSAALAFAILGGAVLSGETAISTSSEADLALERGIRWLVEHQNEDGSWTASVGFKLNQNYLVESDERPHVAVSALAGLALLAQGDDAGSESLSAAQAAVAFLRECAHPITGYISRDGTDMHGHALATLLLSEAMQRFESDDIDATLRGAVRFIGKTQSEAGGWRYLPYEPDSDLPVTASVLVALSAARTAGVNASETTFARSRELMARLYIDSDRPHAHLSDGYYFVSAGAFRYQPKLTTRSSFAVTAAGVAAARACGFEPESWSASVGLLDRTYDQIAERPEHYFYWYSELMAAHAFLSFGGDAWDQHRARSHDNLVRLARDDGSWRSTVGPGDAFSTAVACLVLQAPRGELSVFRHR